MVDEDVQDGFSSVMYLPGPASEDREGWRVNTGAITKSFVTPYQLDSRQIQLP